MALNTDEAFHFPNIVGQSDLWRKHEIQIPSYLWTVPKLSDPDLNDSFNHAVVSIINAMISESPISLVSLIQETLLGCIAPLEPHFLINPKAPL